MKILLVTILAIYTLSSAVSAQTILDPEGKELAICQSDTEPLNCELVQLQGENLALCRTSINGQKHWIVYDRSDEKNKDMTYREKWFGKTSNITCPAYTSLKVLLPELSDVERTVFCLQYDNDEDTIVGFAKGKRDAYLFCSDPSVPICKRVNDSKGAALRLSGYFSGAVAGGSAVATASGVTAVTHSSGALMLTGNVGYIAGTLGTSGATLVAILTAPVTLVLATATAAAVGGAVYFCSVEAE